MLRTKSKLSIQTGFALPPRCRPSPSSFLTLREDPTSLAPIHQRMPPRPELTHMLTRGPSPDSAMFELSIRPCLFLLSRARPSPTLRPHHPSRGPLFRYTLRNPTHAQTGPVRFSAAVCACTSFHSWAYEKEKNTYIPPRRRQSRCLPPSLSSPDHPTSLAATTPHPRPRAWVSHPL